MDSRVFRWLIVIDAGDEGDWDTRDSLMCMICLDKRQQVEYYSNVHRNSQM